MVKRKIVVETDNSSWQAPKTRKKRKPMTEVQRVAAAKRLEKARAYIPHYKICPMFILLILKRLKHGLRHRKNLQGQNVLE